MTERTRWQWTKLVEGGRRKEWRGRLVNPPVERASTLLFDSVADLEGGTPRLGEYRYGLQGTATHWALSEALTGLEPGAAGTALFSSGLAAITTTLLEVLSQGGELLVTDSAYGPTRRFCDTILKRLGIATRYYPPLIGADIAGLITERTRAILLESPGSHTMEVQDVRGICGVAAGGDIVTIIDNTWATPLLFPALEAGVDITILPATKYVAGHADLLLGTVTAIPKYFTRIQLDCVGPWSRSVGRRCLACASRPAYHGGSAEAASGKRADRRQVAQRAITSRQGPASRTGRLSRTRALASRLQRFVWICSLRAERCQRQRPSRFRRPASVVRHRLQLGRIRKPGDAR